LLRVHKCTYLLTYSTPTRTLTQSHTADTVHIIEICQSDSTPTRTLTQSHTADIMHIRDMSVRQHNHNHNHKIGV